jgi:fructose-bisphosphate aldolase class I
MKTHPLDALAQQLVAPDHGILAADESSGTIEKRFRAVGVPCTEVSRRDYRELLFSSPGIDQHLSGVILYEETLGQTGRSGRRLVQMLEDRGILPGIKVDRGVKALPGHPEESVTEGLDGLRERLSAYREQGARFTKWRAVIAVDEQRPSAPALRANAEALAHYAKLVQEAGMVPIVEPEVLMEGSHDLDRCRTVTTAALDHLFSSLKAYGVRLEALILKPNMVVPGKQSDRPATVEAVAEATVETLTRTVPAAVPGVAFLSGGQSPEEATRHLNAINLVAARLPWRLTFSFSRALQEPPLRAWAGKDGQVREAQSLFSHRVRLNGLASMGRYHPDLEKVT